MVGKLYRSASALSQIIYVTCGTVALMALWLVSLRADYVGGIAFAVSIFASIQPSVMAYISLHRNPRSGSPFKGRRPGTRVIGGYLQRTTSSMKLALVGWFAGGALVVAVGWLIEGAALTSSSFFGLGIAMLVAALNILQCNAFHDRMDRDKSLPRGRGDGF